MVVAKFGGSSLLDADGFKRVADIVRKNKIQVVIVSAPGGKPKVTDMLISAYDEWEKGGRCDKTFDKISGRFMSIAAAFDINIDTKLIATKAAINAGGGYDYTVSRGEYLSALLLAEILNYKFIDAKQCIKLTLEGKIDFTSIKAHSGVVDCPCVIPGFYGKLPNGEIKLLPRGGSDISGSAIAAALGSEYQKWTDVDGIYNGVGGVIDNLSYDEAEMLCYFGASVMQYESMPILKNAGVKLTVKNTFTEAPGTVVSDKKYNGFAFSSKKMFVGGSEAAKNQNKIINAGLKIPFKVSLLGKEKILIDGCGFSPLALKRILCYDDIKPVTVTAAIGDIPFSIGLGNLFYCGDVGNLYLASNS